MSPEEATPESDVADWWVAVPSTDVPRIQEAHVMIGHIWSELVEAAIFGRPMAGSAPTARRRGQVVPASRLRRSVSPCTRS